jgi:hypothetical protein
MLDSISSIASFATQMSTQNLAQQIDFAVLKKAQDIDVQQSKDAIQLIASSTVPVSSIDVHV